LCTAVWPEGPDVTDSSSGVVIDVDQNDWLKQCVGPFKDEGFPSQTTYSNYYLIDMPSGLCADHLSCAFENCNLTLDAVVALRTNDLSKTDIKELKPSLPPLNLPSKVAFPRGVRDVVEVVKYAAKNSLQISMKTSGHSYIGSSTLVDSVLIHLSKFPKYTKAASAIVECGDDHFKTAACELAKARGKRAIIRVGGGEVWDDVYRGIESWNSKRPPQDRYIAVGGGAGTVGAAGGWLQGGGLSTHVDRTYGFGVDQVLQVEMVMADGTHVQFGPSKWEPIGGYVYPKTLKVEGKCNRNVDEDESKWEWSMCEKRIPFEKLWFAVRGGGGGTYGVVTAVHFQLHQAEEFFLISPDPSASATIQSTCTRLKACDKISRMMVDFTVAIFWNPSTLGVDEETSNRCGCPSWRLTSPIGMCQGNGVADIFVQAWQTQVSRSVTEEPVLQSMNQTLFNAFVKVGPFESYAQALTYLMPTFKPAGHVPDGPAPATIPTNAGCWSALVPKTWLAQKSEDVYELFMKYFSDAHIIGGNTNRAHDQMTAVTQQQRNAGMQMCFPMSAPPDVVQKYRRLFLDTAAQGSSSFPGFTELNHITFKSIGPLKTDWTAPCPYNATKDEQEEYCHSLQESVWGEKGVEQLEEIKKIVDPKSVFNCVGCIGYVASPPTVLI
jgi:hypothetical protein